MSKKPVDWSKPIRTTCGKPAKPISMDYKSVVEKKNIVIVQIEYNKDCSAISFFDQDGTRLGPYDIENIPEERWVIEWVAPPTRDPYVSQHIFSSKEDAEAYANTAKIPYKLWILADE